MANPAEQFYPPGVDRDKVEEIKKNKPVNLKLVKGEKKNEPERWSPKEFVDQEKWSPEELTGRKTPQNAEEFLRQKEEDERQVDMLENAIAKHEEHERTEGRLLHGNIERNEPPMDKVRNFETVGVKPPEPIMELGEEDIEEDLTPTNRIPELANKQAVDYGDLQPGMADLPELSSEFLQEDDEEAVDRAA